MHELLGRLERGTPGDVTIISDNAPHHFPISLRKKPRRRSRDAITGCVAEIRRVCRWERLTSEKKRDDIGSLTVPSRNGKKNQSPVLPQRNVWGTQEPSNQYSQQQAHHNRWIPHFKLPGHHRDQGRNILDADPCSSKCGPAFALSDDGPSVFVAPAEITQDNVILRFSLPEETDDYSKQDEKDSQ